MNWEKTVDGLQRELQEKDEQLIAALEQQDEVTEDQNKWAITTTNNDHIAYKSYINECITCKNKEEAKLRHDDLLYQKAVQNCDTYLLEDFLSNAYADNKKDLVKCILAAKENTPSKPDIRSRLKAAGLLPQASNKKRYVYSSTDCL